MKRATFGTERSASSAGNQLPHFAAFRFTSVNGDKASGKLQITLPLPVVPVAGDMFKIFVGGKTASSQEVLAMKVSGKQPEVDPVTGPNVTGITIKKASAMLGTGTLEVRYEYTNRILKLRMNSGDSDTFSTVEETAVAIEALTSFSARKDVAAALERAWEYLLQKIESNEHRAASPIGLYFSQLWYYEDLYPLLFTAAALKKAASV